LDKTTRNIITVGSIGLIALVYFALLSAKQWTWTFVSGDSGDWLAASTWWFVPQPYGSPLYILLGHALNSLPGNLVLKMTIILSCLSSAVTVSIVYLITKKLTESNKIAIISSAVLLACGIFLSQSTVLEEYAITTMFVTLSFWFYINNKRALTVVCLGLGTAIHIIIGVISVLWFALHAKEIRTWAKYIPIYIAVGVLPYSLVLILMYLPDTAHFLAGNLSLQSINAYLGSTGVVGSISIVEAPRRLLEAIVVVLAAFGVSLFAFWHGLKKPWTMPVRMAITAIAFCTWLYITNRDPSTWTFITFSTPLIAVLVGLGLSKLESYHCKIVMISCCLLIALNSVFLNANLITQANPSAVKYEQAIKGLPEHSAVVLPRGGPYALGLFYAITQGKNVIPLFLTGEKADTNQGYIDYIAWVEEKWGIQGDNVLEQSQYCLDNNIPIYFLSPMLVPAWEPVFTFTNNDTYFSPISGVGKELPDWQTLNGDR